MVVSRPENHWQTFAEAYNPSFSSEVKVPMHSIQPMELGPRKVIARRAAFASGDDDHTRKAVEFLAAEFPGAEFITVEGPAELNAKAAEADVILGYCTAEAIAAFEEADLIAPDSQVPLGSGGRVLLPHGAGGSVAGVHEDRAPLLGLAPVVGAMGARLWPAQVAGDDLHLEAVVGGLGYELTREFDAAAVKRAERMDGKFVLLTNDDTLHKEDVATGYKALMIIEAQRSS